MIDDDDDDEIDIEWNIAQQKYYHAPSWRHRCEECDGIFQDRLLDAIRRGLERCPTAVSTAPCTKQPIFVSRKKAALFGEALASS
jgi:hypothetical protein